MQDSRKNMFRKCLTFLLAFALLFSSMPMTAFAETEPTEANNLVMLDHLVEAPEQTYEEEDNLEEDDAYVENDNAAQLDIDSLSQEIIYALSSDLAVQNLALGTTGNQVLATPHLQPSGSPTFTVVENPNGGNSIEVSGRTANWNTIDLLRGPLDLEIGQLYTITVSGRMEAPFDTFVIAGPTSPFGWLASTTPNEEGEFTLTATINYTRLNDAQFANAFRLQAQNNSTYIIDEIIVHHVGTEPEWTPPIETLDP